jgi:hypothetical protein
MRPLTLMPKQVKMEKLSDLALPPLQVDLCNEQWDAVDEQRPSPICQQPSKTQN